MSLYKRFCSALQQSGKNPLPLCHAARMLHLPEQFFTAGFPTEPVFEITVENFIGKAQTGERPHAIVCQYRHFRHLPLPVKLGKGQIQQAAPGKNQSRIAVDLLQQAMNFPDFLPGTLSG